MAIDNRQTSRTGHRAHSERAAASAPNITDVFPLQALASCHLSGRFSTGGVSSCPRACTSRSAALIRSPRTRGRVLSTGGCHPGRGHRVGPLPCPRRWPAGGGLPGIGRSPPGRGWASHAPGGDPHRCVDGPRGAARSASRWRATRLCPEQSPRSRRQASPLRRPWLRSTPIRAGPILAWASAGGPRSRTSFSWCWPAPRRRNRHGSENSEAWCDQFWTGEVGEQRGPGVEIGPESFFLGKGRRDHGAHHAGAVPNPPACSASQGHPEGSGRCAEALIDRGSSGGSQG